MADAARPSQRCAKVGGRRCQVQYIERPKLKRFSLDGNNPRAGSVLSSLSLMDHIIFNGLYPGHGAPSSLTNLARKGRAAASF